MPGRSVRDAASGIRSSCLRRRALPLHRLRRAGAARQRVMTLQASEFLRRMLLHVLPPGFHRIRYYGFLANRTRQRKLTECRHLLHAPPPPAERAEAATNDYRDRYEALTGRSLRRCPPLSPRGHARRRPPRQRPAGSGHSGFVVTGPTVTARRRTRPPGSPGRSTCVSQPLTMATERPSDRPHGPRSCGTPHARPGRLHVSPPLPTMQYP